MSSTSRSAADQKLYRRQRSSLRSARCSERDTVDLLTPSTAAIWVTFMSLSMYSARTSRWRGVSSAATALGRFRSSRRRRSLLSPAWVWSQNSSPARSMGSYTVLAIAAEAPVVVAGRQLGQAAALLQHGPQLRDPATQTPGLLLIAGGTQGQAQLRQPPGHQRGAGVVLYGKL